MKPPLKTKSSDDFQTPPENYDLAPLHEGVQELSTGV